MKGEIQSADLNLLNMFFESLNKVFVRQTVCDSFTIALQIILWDSCLFCFPGKTENEKMKNKNFV